MLHFRSELLWRLSTERTLISVNMEIRSTHNGGIITVTDRASQNSQH